MRIEFLLGSTAVGGAELQVARLAATLRRDGHDVSVVVVVDDGPVGAILDEAGVDRCTVGYTGVRWGPVRFVPSLDSWRDIARLLRFTIGRRRVRHADISYAFLPGTIALAPLLEARGGGRPLRVAGVRSSGVYAPVTTYLFHRVAGRAAAVVCNAPHLVDFVVDSGVASRSRVHVIANGLDAPEWVADTAPSPARGVVVANFYGYKGYETLLQAMTLVDPSIVVHLCGKGPTRAAMIELAAELGLRDRVMFVDPPADVAAELRAAQFAIHPSHTEGLSNAILEQLAAGLPVVACDVGGNSTLVADGVNGLLVPPGDAIALARAIDAVAADPDLRAEMGRASRERSRDFDWDRCAQAHIALFERLLAER